MRPRTEASIGSLRVLRGFRIVLLTATCAAAVLSSASCRRAPELPPDVYREVVVAFHTALAAIDTSQEVLARQKLDRVVELAPQEPAGWADLGLLLLRQQEIEAARERLARAAELAPSAAAIVRMQALAESRAGNLAESTRLWQRAVELDPGDVKAAYALAQETERQGGAEQEQEAQRVLERLLARTENLPARLDYARLAAKRGDAEALSRALAPLAAASAGWPQAARDRLESLRAAAATNPRAAATQVAFLRNVLAREVAYRRALAQVTTPLDAVGEPIARFLVLPTPTPASAPPDAGLTYAVHAAEGWPANVGWVGVVAVDGEHGESIVASNGAEVFTATNGAPGSPPTAPTSSAPTNGRRGTLGLASRASVVAADLDYDFRTDLVLAGEGGLRLLRRQEDDTLRDVTSTALPDAVTRLAVRAGWPADVDLDGDLDVVVAPAGGLAFVLRNNGDGTFARQQPFGPCSQLRDFVWADLDGEGVPDAACLDASGAVQVFPNARGGTFDVAHLPQPPGTFVAVTAADVTGDGRMDVVGLSPAGAVVRLAYEEPTSAASPAAPRWTWQQMAAAGATLTNLAADTTRLLAADVDNNGAVDLIVSSARETRILLSARDGSLTPLAPLPLATNAIADLDDDGLLELVGLTPEGRVATARGKATRNYHWQRLRLRAASASGDQRVNSFGIGGEVEVRSGTHAVSHPVTGPVLHVGLGEATAADVIRIMWPNGVLQSEFEQKADATVRASQRLKGSCPWLFAWNGREMAFVTDLIWRSPLGLRINAQATADVSMTEDWVKVGGTQLTPRDGAYDLRVTAELWETHFFDLVSLAVIDHPEGTEVFVDERFSVPGPALTPIVTGPLRAFAAVEDDTGKDVRNVVVARDDRHLDFAGRGRYQGVTRQHAVELTLPDAASADGPLWLIAQGWVHPTDSSINVAMAQGRTAAPRGLALEVADAHGRFHVVRENLGFPAGKDKTILIDLAGLLPKTGGRRLRLTTNLEIFWDRLAWAEGRPDAVVTPRRLPLASAMLRYRGFSVTPAHASSSPERPAYTVEGTAPRWLDLEGFHTRFGDVRPLLDGVDDRYVIMNAGDELALRFPEAPAVATGHVRDFILISDGWVKDGDFNTSFSRTVLPLPTHASGRYDRAPRTLEADPMYQPHSDDFATYHTRYVAPDARRTLRTGSSRLHR